MADLVRYQLSEHIATLTIDRPDALNALNSEVLRAFEARVDEAVDSGARAIIVTGAGKAFVAGADIGEMAPLDRDGAHAFSEAGHRLLDKLEGLDVPLIAAVNGFALGGGMELALTCDIRLASERAVFGLPEVTLGVLPGFGGTQRLSRMAGMGAALDLVLTGRKIDAAEALRLGVVTHVVPGDELLERATALAGQIAAAGPVAVALAKQTVRRGFEEELSAADAREAEAFGACFATADQKEGMAAFLEKRKPSYKGA